MMPAVGVNNAEVRRSFLHRTLPQAIDQLKDDAVPTWGRMTPQHMVEHLMWAFELSRGCGQVDCPIPESRRQRMKAFLFDNLSSPRAFRNPALSEEFVPLRFSSLEAAIAALKAELQRYASYVRAHPGVVHVHPVFGPLTVEEWERSHYNHCIHHLLQFDLNERETSKAVRVSSTLPVTAE